MDSDDLDMVEDIHPEATDDSSDVSDTDSETPAQTAESVMISSQPLWTVALSQGCVR